MKIESALSVIETAAIDVSLIIERVRRYLSDKRPTTPCYVFDPLLVGKQYERLKKAFRHPRIDTKIYYAVKSNPYPLLLRTVTELGASLDISSGYEYGLAKNSAAESFVFTGPAKTESDLLTILREKRPVTVHLESKEDMRKVQRVGNKLRRTVSCGVRVVPTSHNAWNKFGIGISELKDFLEAARHLSKVKINGIHFHMSYATSATPYVSALKEIAASLKALPAFEVSKFSFIDIGGGFYPEPLEGEYPWNKDGTLLFDTQNLREEILQRAPKDRVKKIIVSPIEEVGKEILHAFEKFIRPLCPKADLLIEPGRYLSQNAMHILLRVLDKKEAQSVIADGGWNMVGWEKFQYLYYAPIFNVSNEKVESEKPCIVYGNLCIPDDIWGYYVHGEPNIKDYLLLPCQGAYTYTYRQSFIRGIPGVITLPDMALDLRNRHHSS